ESVPYFLVAGLLFVLTAPSLLQAQLVLYGFVVTRFLHFAAYLSAQAHDIRALLWTPGSLLLIYMAGRVLVQAIA
ncbi:MAG: MAPEG family protein, partial [Geminicoccaceae bacterium]